MMKKFAFALFAGVVIVSVLACLLLAFDSIVSITPDHSYGNRSSIDVIDYTHPISVAAFCFLGSVAMICMVLYVKSSGQDS